MLHCNVPIKRLTTVLICIICLSFASSDVSPFPFKNSSLLWKIEGPNIPSGSYLFGTMHLIEKEYFVFPDKLKKIVSKTDCLVMEMAGLPNQTEALKYVMLKEGSFFDYFTPEQTDSIFKWAKEELKMEQEVFRMSMSKMKPFVVVQLATQMNFMGKTESYEMSFEKIAKDNKIELQGLETLEQQMSFFDNLTNEEQAEMVMEGIRTSKESISSIQDMEKVYQRQNIDSLYLLIHNDKGIISKKETDFLDNRNANWVPQIKKMIASKKCFIAVGAGHLGGPNGIIRLLEKDGYTITPVQLK